MTKKPNRSTVPLNVQISKDVRHALDEFCDSRDEKIRDVIEMAIRRHIASPPPKIEVPPLPPLAVTMPKKK